MSFSIKLKPKGSSNKHNTPLHFKLVSPSQEVLPVEAPTPFIDRLSVTLKVPTKAQGQEMWKAHWLAVEDAQTFKKQGYGKEYNKRYRISLPSLLDAKHWPLYEVGYEQGCITHLRLDFNPADLGPEGLFELHSVLIALMDSGWWFVAKHAKVTRVDVAVDFPQVEIDQVHWLPQQSLTTIQWKQNGLLGSFQLGKSSGNCTMIYDRAAKRSAQGKAWQGKKGIRVEKRLRNPGIFLRDLSKLSWPLAGLHMVKMIPGPPACEPKSYIWQYFLAKAEQAGMAAALALLPEAKRTKYRKHLKQQALPLLDEKLIWPRWANTLAELKISDAKYWH